MADLTSAWLGSSSVTGPRKRPRLDFAQAASPSVIEDVRVSALEARKFDGDIVNVIVGHGEGDEGKVLFKVHQNALCDRSVYFANERERWLENRETPNTIPLNHVDPDAFSLYHTYVYTGKLAIVPDSPCNQCPNGSTSQISITGTGDDHHNQTLAWAYVLGERLLDIPFKNAIADAYVLYARGIPPTRRYYPSNEEIRIIYDGTPLGSPMRKLLVDIWYCRGKKEWIEKNADGLPWDFLRDVTAAFLEHRTNVESLSRPWKNSHLQYHDREREGE